MGQSRRRARILLAVPPASFKSHRSGRDAMNTIKFVLRSGLEAIKALGTSSFSSSKSCIRSFSGAFGLTATPQRTDSYEFPASSNSKSSLHDGLDATAPCMHLTQVEVEMQSSTKSFSALTRDSRTANGVDGLAATSARM